VPMRKASPAPLFKPVLSALHCALLVDPLTAAVDR
jgi:hypothetical protein